MPDAREAALAAMAGVHCKNHNPTPPMYVQCDVDHPECALDALASSPEVREALVAVVEVVLPYGAGVSAEEIAGAVLAALAGTSGTEAG